MTASHLCCWPGCLSLHIFTINCCLILFSTSTHLPVQLLPAATPFASPTQSLEYASKTRCNATRLSSVAALPSLIKQRTLSGRTFVETAEDCYQLAATLYASRLGHHPLSTTKLAACVLSRAVSPASLFCQWLGRALSGSHGHGQFYHALHCLYCQGGLQRRCPPAACTAKG